MALTDKQVLVIASAGVLLPHASAALSDFELETVAEISRRYLRHGQGDAIVTELEWPVFEEAVEAMRRAVQRRAAKPAVVRTEAA